MNPRGSGIHARIDVPAIEGNLARAKPLPISTEQIGRLRSKAKKLGRKRSRELIRDAMQHLRCLVLDFADAVDVDERCARRALVVDEQASPIDLGEMLNMASTGPGGARLARAILMAHLREIDSIEFSSKHS